MAQNRISIEERILRIESRLLPNKSNGQTVSSLKLADRMRFYETPGVSIAVINDGKLEWARGYGILEAGSRRPVTTETLFQACSISKPVAAMAALYFVETGKLDLDEDVNQKLVSWKIPENEFTKEKKVTLRRLLSHSAGVTVVGFEGYASNEPVPTPGQILDGRHPANSEPIRVDTIPGTQWRYSGGGFTIVQQILMDISGKAFPETMRELVLQKLEMKDSTYQQPLPAHLSAQAASGHQSNGEKVKGSWFIYPEMAAAGLWTTPSDLARFAIELQQSKSGKSNKVLSMGMTNQMLRGQVEDFPRETESKRYGRETRDHGLGLRLEGGDHSDRFSHGGSNEGYRCFLVAYADLGQGVVVMTNSQNGSELCQEIIRSIAREYGWVDYPFDVI